MFENANDIIDYTACFLPTIEIKYYNVMIYGPNFFDQPVKINLRTYKSIWKITADQWDDYAIVCFLYYNYFNEYYKMMATDLSKQQVLKVDAKAKL